MTTIRVNEETRKKLNELKTELEMKNLDEVILYLIEIHLKYSNAKIVRVIE